eukprot:TRINITY_DN12000_c0_g1_i1.p1 TRINITY_DN12000_c0_g1~~TRINITY_DN12000_c0_g1_i1.p1  ORF type:complete len:556 (+),score=231.50 TRINITY_DN12000_c0_g1_i1:102-1769(+)
MTTGSNGGYAAANGDDKVTQASLLSSKISRYGVLGAGVITDSLTSVKMAEAKEAERAEALAREKRKEEVAAAVAKRREEIARAEAAKKAAELAKANGAAEAAQISAEDIAAGKPLTRPQILHILAETVRVQGIVQQEVSQLARQLAKDKPPEKKKRKAPVLSFIEGHKKILELGLPKEPLEEYKLCEANFQKMLLEYENDQEVMEAAQMLLHPAGKGDPARAEGISIDKIVEIHQFMVDEMQKVLQEFLALPREERRQFTGKGCETTAELLVSIALEQQLSVRCEDVEQAVIKYEQLLQTHPDFTRCTEQLANMMQRLIGAAQPRVEAAEFVKILKHMGESTKKAKVFAKKLFEDYRVKKLTVIEAYKRFEEFSAEVACTLEGEELPELSSIELQICYDEFKDDPEVLKAWDSSGAEGNMLMQAFRPPSSAAESPAKADEAKPKGKKLKSGDVIEMQELMVDELKRTVEAVVAASKNGSAVGWKTELAVQMVQALASAAVERRYGVSAEEMTAAVFQHAQALQRNERFVRANEKQQELLMQIPQAFGHGGAANAE